jgi:hypothetical protein
VFDSIYRNAFSVMIGAILGAFSVPAVAMPVPAIVVTDMCAKSVDLPTPLGESDLKGNPKLAAYCACFNRNFMARIEESARKGELMKPKPVEQSVKEERAMRNGCRTQVGLPLIDFSKDPFKDGS